MNFIIQALKFTLSLSVLAVIVVAISWLSFYLCGNLEGKMRGPNYNKEKEK